jgi:hypothetical protein
MAEVVPGKMWAWGVREYAFGRKTFFIAGFSIGEVSKLLQEDSPGEFGPESLSRYGAGWAPGTGAGGTRG